MDAHGGGRIIASNCINEDGGDYEDGRTPNQTMDIADFS